MRPCSRCGSQDVGRSPTGDWCNACGDCSPCPCHARMYCAAHDPKHAHQWDSRGDCVGRKDGCAATMRREAPAGAASAEAEQGIPDTAKPPNPFAGLPYDQQNTGGRI